MAVPSRRSGPSARGGSLSIERYCRRKPTLAFPAVLPPRRRAALVPIEVSLRHRGHHPGADATSAAQAPLRPGGEAQNPSHPLLRGVRAQLEGPAARGASDGGAPARGKLLLPRSSIPGNAAPKPSFRSAPLSIGQASFAVPSSSTSSPVPALAVDASSRSSTRLSSPGNFSASRPPHPSRRRPGLLQLSFAHH